MTNPDEQLQRLLSESLGPQPLRDDDVERLLDAESAAELSDVQASRILHDVQESIRADRTTRVPSFPLRRELSVAAHFEASTVTTPAPEITMKRIPSRDSRHNPRGAIACLLVSALSLAGVLMVTSEESERQQERVAVYQAERENARQQIRREWLTAKFVAQPEVQRVAVGDTIQTSPTERRRVTLPDGSALYVNTNASVKIAAPRQVEVARGEVFVEVVPQFDESDESAPFKVVTPSRTVTAFGTKFAVDASNDSTDVLVTQGSVQVSDVETPVVAGQLLNALNSQPSTLNYRLTAAPRASESLNWTRELITAAAGALVPASEYAGGAIITVNPNGQEMKLSLRKYHVDVHIEHGFARTTIDHTYFNHTSQRLEGTFHFPLPPDASLSRLAMYVNGKLMEGGMAERQHARNTFEQIVSKMKDPALLEWVDGSTFKMRVFPLEPRQEKRIVLSYTQRLASAYGRLHYRFPAGHSMDAVLDWSMAIRVKDGADVAWNSPSHELQSSTDDGDLLLEAVEQNSTMERDIVLELQETRTSRSALGSRLRGNDGEVEVRSPHAAGLWTRSPHGDHEYLMLRFRPELPATMQRPKRNWIILFESSANRDPLLARTQIEIVRTLLDNAEHDDTFSVIAAKTRASALAESQQCTARNIAEVLRRLEETHLVGAFDFEKALTACEQLSSAGRENLLIHVGAGIPVLGEQDQSALLKKLPRQAAYVGVGVGRRWSQSFMKQAASRTGGYFTQINPDEEVAWRAFELSSVLNAPRLLDVSVGESRRDSATARDTFSKETGNATPLDVARGSSEAGPGQYVESRRDSTTDLRFLNFADTIVHGEEVCAVTRLAKDGELPEQVTISGLLNGRPWQQTLSIQDVVDQANYLPRTWAKLEIDRLVAESATANKDRIIELSKAMYVMSPFTSLLVLENEEMYAQYNIDRGRKDHWALYPCPDEIEVVHEPFGVGSETTAEVPQSEFQKLLSSIQSLPQPQVLSYPNMYRILADGTVQPLTSTVSGPNSPVTRLGRNLQHFNYWFDGSPGVYSYSSRGNVDGYFGLDNGVDGDFDADGIVNLNGDMNGNGIIRPLRQATELPSLLLLRGVDSTNGRQPVEESMARTQYGSLIISEAAIHNFADDSGNGRVLYGMPQSLRELETAGSSPQIHGYFVQSESEGWLQTDDLSTLSLLDGSSAMLGADLARHNVFLDGLNRSWEYLPNDPTNTSVEFSLAPFLPKQPAGSRLSLVDRELLETPRFDFGWRQQQLNRDDGAWMLRLGNQPVADSFDVRFKFPQDWSRNVEGLGIPQLESPRIIFGEEEALLGLRDVQAEPMIQELVTELYVESKLRQSALGLDQKSVAGSAGNGHPWSVAPGQRRNAGVQLPTFAAVSYPEFGNDRRFFCDLMSHAPGLNTLPADVWAIVAESDATPRTDASPRTDATPRTDASFPRRREPTAGHVDPVARELIERARSLGWERVTLPGNDALTILVDGTGRHVYERTVSEGLRERVICDGESLLHVYRDIGFAAKRDFSKFHRREIESLIPWLLPSVEALAAGADILPVDEHTVAVRPLPRSRTLPWNTLPEGSASGTSDATERTELSERSEQMAEPARQSVPGQSPGTRPRDLTTLVELRLVFGDDGRLMERRLVEQPSGEILLTIHYDETGTVEIINADGDVISSVELQREPSDAPDLTPELADVVALPMPIRSAEHVFESNHDDGNEFSKWSEERALALVLADSAAGNGERVVEVIRERFFEQGDTRDGLYVLLSRFPQLLASGDSTAVERRDQSPVGREGSDVDGQTREVSLLPSPEGSPLRQFVRQWIRWQQDNSDSSEFAIEGPEGGFVQRLATARNLYLRWKSGQAIQDRTDAQVKVELDRMLNFVGGCRTDVMGWTLLSVVEKNLAHDKFGADFAAAAERFENNPLLGWLARQERCRTRFRAGKATQARRLYSELLLQTAQAGRLPRIEPEMRQLFIGEDGQQAWLKLMTELGESLLPTTYDGTPIPSKSQRRDRSPVVRHRGASPSQPYDGLPRRSRTTSRQSTTALEGHPTNALPRAAFLLSVQLRQLGDVEAAEELLSRILKQLDTKQRPDVALLAVEQLRQLGRSGADQVLSSVLELEPLRDSSALWRYSAQVADAVGNKRLALERFEHAIQIDFRDRPDVINLESLRTDYADLLNRYDEIVKAAATLGQAPQNDLTERIVRAADQWRSIDDDDTTCCQATARLLTKLNRDQLAWDYLTTPLAGSSGESVPWRNLAQTLTDQQQVALADIAWTRAFEFERTNPELLLSHAQMLIAAGRSEDGSRLLRQIVDGNWQPRFRSTVDHARTLLRP